jgi:hypothetical protein
MGTDPMAIDLRPLETHIDWGAKDVADTTAWTVVLDDGDHAELDRALRTARAQSISLLDIDRDAFPLDRLRDKLLSIERQLIDGRGFVCIASLDIVRYSDEELTWLYWGIGNHLGVPWPQNRHGHMMGDVTDQGRSPDDPRSRGNELGEVGLDYHSDGSDLVGLLCLRAARRGGKSCVANAVAIHNELVMSHPDLATALYERLPWDYRGEEPPGSRPYYLRPVFTAHDARLFAFFIPQYILASQRHPEAPRLTATQREAIDTVATMARDARFNVYMDLPPGSMQFINNYHVLHGRMPYEDDVAHGYKRHLKRLWLASRMLEARPAAFVDGSKGHWAQNRTISHIAPIARRA